VNKRCEHDGVNRTVRMFERLLHEREVREDAPPRRLHAQRPLAGRLPVGRRVRDAAAAAAQPQPEPRRLDRSELLGVESVRRQEDLHVCAEACTEA